MSTDHDEVTRVAGPTVPSCGRHVFTKAEIDSIKARTPEPQGSPEERRDRLHRALHSFASRKDYAPASRLLDRS